MAASTKSLSSLLAQASLDDHDEILRAANAAVKKSKTDVDAHHAKAIALLHLDRYEDALEVFEHTQALQEKARFEYAYALYKTGNGVKAAEVAGAAGPDAGRGMKHMLAQAAYRSENFAQAAKVYRELANQPVEDEEYDIRINSGAVDSQLEWTGQGELAQKKKPTREDLEVFETAFNAACGSIARGELAQGEVCLKRAKDLCNALSDLSDAEKQAELLPITVQQVYVLTQLGKMDQADELATAIPFADIKELSTRYIAQVNSIAASKAHSNPYRSHRLFHSSPKPPATDQHFSFQFNILFGVLPNLIEMQRKGFSNPPSFAEKFSLPTKTIRDVDTKFVAGAAVFGIGWGLTGTCPGPAVLRAFSQPLWGALWMGGFWLGGRAMF